MVHTALEATEDLDGASVGDDDLYLMVNAYWEDVPFRIQTGAPGDWYRVVDTSASPPDDFREENDRQKLDGLDYVVRARSTVVLIRPRKSG